MRRPQNELLQLASATTMDASLVTASEQVELAMIRKLKDDRYRLYSRKFVKLEQELVTLLERRVKKDRQILIQMRAAGGAR